MAMAVVLSLVRSYNTVGPYNTVDPLLGLYSSILQGDTVFTEGIQYPLREYCIPERETVWGYSIH